MAKATANTLVNGVPTAGVLSNYTSRYAKGPSGEPLDAFVFGSATFGESARAMLMPHAERFVDAGYAVYLFDYRNLGDSEGQPRH